LSNQFFAVRCIVDRDDNIAANLRGWSFASCFAPDDDLSSQSNPWAWQLFAVSRWRHIGIVRILVERYESFFALLNMISVPLNIAGSTPNLL
jgi:hypothetical protein